MTKSPFNRSQVKFLAMLAIGLASGWAVSAFAETPTNQVNMIPAGLVNYQGTLLTPENVPYTNGIYDIDFRVYPESSSSLDEALWGAGYKVFVNNGVFGVMLGQSGGAVLNDNPAEFKPDELWKALWFDERSPDNLDLFLGITVKQDQNHNPIPVPAEAVPRQQFLVTPFAARAQQAMYARRSSGDFDVGGALTAGSFSGSGTNLTGVALLAGGNSFSGSQTFDTNVTVQGRVIIGQDWAASGEESLRIVRGSMYCNGNNPDPTRFLGSGWSVGNATNGKYTVYFNRPFSSPPTVIVTPWSDIKGHRVIIPHGNISNNLFEAWTYDSGDDLRQLSFHFIAIGTR